MQKTSTVFRNLGNVDAEFAKGGKVLEATYYTPLAAHASMEPPSAVADVRDGKVTVWAPTQNPQAVQEAVAAAVGIDKKEVTCHVTLLGGGFGRKSKPDYCAEAAVLSKQLGKPVKVTSSRSWVDATRRSSSTTSCRPRAPPANRSHSASASRCRRS